jgi:hypothetical protein
MSSRHSRLLGDELGDKVGCIEERAIRGDWFLKIVNRPGFHRDSGVS